MSFRESKGWFSRVRDLPRMGGLAMVENGDQVIEALGLAEQTYANAMKHLGVLCTGYLVLSWAGLAMQYWGPRIQRVVAADKKLRQRRQGPASSSADRTSATKSKTKQFFKAPVPLKM